MPQLTANDAVLLFVANAKIADLSGLPSGRYPFPLNQMIPKVTSDRLTLAGEHLRAGDQLILNLEFRSAISRHYYAMYHAARAVVFSVSGGDDFERHGTLPRHLPPLLPSASDRQIALTEARLLRNQADYDPYPSAQADWESDARGLSAAAADFCQSCEDFALSNGHI